MSKQPKKTKAAMKPNKGAETRKASIGPRVTQRLKDLRDAIAAGNVSGPFSKSFVLRWIAVDKHTIKDRKYHAESAKKIEDFLLETDRACGVVERKPKKPKKRSMREQMVAMAREAEVMRLRMQCQIDDLTERLQPKGKVRRPDPKNFRSIVRVGNPLTGTPGGHAA